MNTAEKVARLEAFLQRVQTNSKLPRPQRRASAAPATDVAGFAALAPGDGAPVADAARAAAELEAQRIMAERAAKEAADRAAREAAESALAARTAAENAAREATERAAKDAAERAAKEAAAREAADRVARDAAERVAREAAERVAREAAAKEAREKAAKEAAEKLAADKAAREAADRAAKEKLAAEKAAKEAAAKEAADRAAKEKAEKLAAEKAAKEAADKAAKEAAAKEAAAKEAAAKEAAAKAAADKATKDAADKAAKEKAAKEAADKAARAAKEKAVQEAADKAAKQATEKAAKEAAEVPPKKQPSTIDELFAELENSGDATKVGPVETVLAAATAAKEKAAATPPKPPAIKDETTIDTGDMPTVIADLGPMAKGDDELPTRTAPALPMDAPTRVAEPFASLLDPPTLDSPTIVFGDKPGLDRSPEPDEPTVIRRPTAKDQALLRGEEVPAEAEPGRDAPIKPAPVIAIGEPAAEGEEDGASPSGLHEPKVELAAPLRVQAQIALKEAAQRAAQEAAQRAEEEAKQPKPEKVKEREEVTTASRRMVQLTPELVDQERQVREREDEAKNKKKGLGSTIGLTLATAALVGGALYLALSKGWFDSGGPPAPTTSVSAPPTGRPQPTSPVTAVTTGGPAVAPPTGAPSTSAVPSGTPTAEPTAAPATTGAASEMVAKANASPGVAFSEKTDESAKLSGIRSYLTVLTPSSEELFVYVTGKKVGPTNQRLDVGCPVALIRVGVPLSGGGVDWRSAPGLSIPIPCRQSTTIAIPASKGPWPTPGGKVTPGGTAPPGGGGDPY